jgi:serine/threonine protein kinase
MPEKLPKIVGVWTLGERIGRGGFGTVYHATNPKTGDESAIKCIPLAGLSADSLASAESEIDLLKSLDHPNIVKYIGTELTPTHLHIVLEFAENGSLADIIKRFGNLTETLCTVYVAQVLKGLEYLHGQGVIHRDIKGANILTTKSGVVKLADFGVASSFGARGGSLKRDEAAASAAALGGGAEMDVVGTPFWMAPEIVQMSGLTSACDVWSLGCTVIELLTGKAPYFDLAPMRALYRIVQDEYPPMPEGASDRCRDFLHECFQKEPSFRMSAAQLLEHPWIASLGEPEDGDEEEDSDSPLHHGGEDPSGPAPEAAPKTASTAPPAASRAPARAKPPALRRRETFRVIKPAAEQWLEAAGDGTGAGRSASRALVSRGGDGLKKASVAEMRASILNTCKQYDTIRFGGGGARARGRAKPPPPRPSRPPSADKSGRPPRPTGAPGDGAGGDSGRGVPPPAGKMPPPRPTKRPAPEGGVRTKSVGKRPPPPRPRKNVSARAVQASVRLGRAAAAGAHPAPRPAPPGKTGARGTREGPNPEASVGGLPPAGPAGPAGPASDKAASDKAEDNDKATTKQEAAGAPPASGTASADAPFVRLSFGHAPGSPPSSPRGAADARNASRAPSCLSLALDLGLAATSKFEIATASNAPGGGRPRRQTARGQDEPGDDVLAGHDLLALSAEMSWLVGRLADRGDVEEAAVLQAIDAIRDHVTGRPAGGAPPGAASGGASPALPRSSAGASRPGERSRARRAAVARCVFVRSRGIAPLVALVPASGPWGRSPRVALAALGLLNALVRDDTKLLEMLTLVGLVPEVLARLEGGRNFEFSPPNVGRSDPAAASGRSPADRSASGADLGARVRAKIRREASAFVLRLARSSPTGRQMLVACGGLRTLARLVRRGAAPAPEARASRGAETDRAEAGGEIGLVLDGVEGILALLEGEPRAGYGGLGAREESALLCLEDGLASQLGGERGLLLRLLQSPAWSPSDADAAERGGAPHAPGSPLDAAEAVVRALVLLSRGDGAVLEAMGCGDLFAGLLTVLGDAGRPAAPPGGRAGGAPLPPPCVPDEISDGALLVVRNLSACPKNLEPLGACGAVPALVGLLGRCLRARDEADRSASGRPAAQRRPPTLENLRQSAAERRESLLLETIFRLLRLNRARQEEAADAGVVPLLKRVAQERLGKASLSAGTVDLDAQFFGGFGSFGSGPGGGSLARLGTLAGPGRANVSGHELALPLLCELAHAPGVHDHLWESHGVEFYAALLGSPLCQRAALGALRSWLEEDADRVEGVLLRAPVLDKLVGFFRSVPETRLEDLLEPLERMMAASRRLSRALGRASFFVARVLELLQCPAARVRTRLLLVLQRCFRAHPRPRWLLLEFGLYPRVRQLAAPRGMVIVERVASQLIREFDERLGSDGD